MSQEQNGIRDEKNDSLIQRRESERYQTQVSEHHCRIGNRENEIDGNDHLGNVSLGQ